ncbi:MAG: LON peptidase substrate-binding domain-containing protein [Alphaproteobacteria bacterium]|nr:LON peptidase substrate-binding domain-containing protein [Alphaproteobacteria bacterium]
MSDTPDPREERPLPGTLPIFPLTGVLLLPRGRLPLNIFEPRYLAMTSDALGSDRLIGMIQPSNPNVGGMNPPVYPVGCAGRLTSFSETDDGRYLITLTGVSRFRVSDELPLLRGYRRVVPDWSAFPNDREAPPRLHFERARLVAGLRQFFEQRSISVDWDAIEKAPSEYLVTSIAMACPFAPSEKQALLEAADLDARAELLTALVEMAAIEPTTTEDTGGTRH